VRLDRHGPCPVPRQISGAYSQAIEEAWAAGATGVLSKSTDTPNKVVEVLRAALAA
jgi:DNA-binding NarL/FixJ family response regulator